MRSYPADSSRSTVGIGSGDAFAASACVVLVACCASCAWTRRFFATWTRTSTGRGGLGALVSAIGASPFEGLSLSNVQKARGHTAPGTVLLLLLADFYVDDRKAPVLAMLNPFELFVVESTPMPQMKLEPAEVYSTNIRRSPTCMPSCWPSEKKLAAARSVDRLFQLYCHIPRPAARGTPELQAARPEVPRIVRPPRIPESS